MVGAGKTYVQPDLALGLLNYRENPPISSLEKLSPREYEVVMLLMKNKNYDEISESIHLSIKTIYNLKGSAFKKLGVNRLEQIKQIIFPGINTVKI